MNDAFFSLSFIQNLLWKKKKNNNDDSSANVLQFGEQF